MAGLWSAAQWKKGNRACHSALEAQRPGNNTVKLPKTLAAGEFNNLVVPSFHELLKHPSVTPCEYLWFRQTAPSILEQINVYFILF